MPVVIDGKHLLTPKEVREKFQQHKLTESKLRRLSQLGIIPSIPTGIRQHEKGPELRLYDSQELDRLDPAIWESQRPGIKKQGENRYYSRIRRQQHEE